MEKKTFCRICTSACGLIADVDENERVLRITGNREHPTTFGYTCAKGRGLPGAHHHENRLVRPRIQQAGGGRDADWSEILDDLAGALRGVIAEHGPDAVGLFAGGGSYLDAAGYEAANRMRAKLGTRSIYSDMTIDIVSKMIVPEMMCGIPGMMNRADLGKCPLVIYVGTNPFVSHGHSAGLNVPAAFMRQMTSDGEVWVLDPRRTETAAKATRHLGTRPGSDYAVFAFLLREMLIDGADRDYIARHTQGVDRLAEVVEPFTAARASAMSGLAESDLHELLSAVRRAGKLSIELGTGITMSKSGNVTLWLTWALMIITGSLDREGGSWIHPGFFMQADIQEFPLAPEDGWVVDGPRSRPGLRSVLGEFPCSAMSDEIEAGHLRALINLSSSLLTAMPGTERFLENLKSLDVLATIDIVNNATTAISTHVLPTFDQLERADLPFALDFSFPTVSAMYTPAVVAPPPETRPYWWILAQLARRLDIDLFPEFDIDTATDRDVLNLITARGRIPFDADGDFAFYESETRTIGWLEKKVDGIGGWRLAPRLLVEQMATLRPPADLVLISRREPNHCNSRFFNEQDLPGIYVSPTEAEKAGVAESDEAILKSAHGQLQGAIRFDSTLPPGVVTVSHGRSGGNNVNLLTSGNEFDPLSGMVIFCGLPVELTKAAATRPPAVPD